MNPHRASFSRQPLAQLAIALSIGIVAAQCVGVGGAVWWIAGAVCTVATLLCVIKKRLPLAGVALLLAAACAGATLATQEARAEQGGELAQFAGRQVLVTGVLTGPPEFARDRLYLTLNVERLDVNGSTLNVSSGVLSLLGPFRNAVSEQEYRGLQLRYGTRIRVAAKLNRADEYRNPGVSPLSEYLERKGYDATGVVKSAAAISRLEDGSGLSVIVFGTLYDWRERLQRSIHTHFAPETAGVLDAALLGNRYNLSRETAERFREGGTFHVLVISGLHISFIGGVVFLAIKRLTRRRWLQFVVPALFVWAYSLAVGAEASVVRAALMFTFTGLALVLFRDSSSLNALGAATLVLLIHSPHEIFDPSFQLTFLSVLAIVAIGWPLLQACASIGAWYPSRETPYPPECSRGLRWFCELLFWSESKWTKELARSSHRYRMFKTPLAAKLERYRVQACLRYVFAAMIVSAAVQLVLLPLMIVYFHRLSVASLVLNIVVSALLTALATVALLALLLTQLNAALAAPFIKLADAINWLMIHSVDPFAHFNLASIRVPEYSGWGALVYVLYFVPLLVLAVKKKWVLPAVVMQLLLVVLVVAHPLSNGVEGGRLRIDFLDVGQGDAAVITMPDGKVLLVDGGGTTDRNGSNTDRRSIGEAVVSEYLWWRGLDTVDYVLATHADADHIDGLNDVLRNFTVEAALVARTPANDPEYAKFAQTISTTHTNLATIQSGDVIRFRGVEIHVLWPPRALEANEPSRNNDSIVLQVIYGKRKILLTGDIEKGAERALLQSATDLRADVIKVPHHGSKTSSTPPFLVATEARTAIISVGQYSIFGHPHREVVERWQANGAEVLTTGKCGTITVTTDGKDLRVSHKEAQDAQKSDKH
jgi:competence protein ComEC